VVNKIDRPDARTKEVVDEAAELILELGGEEYLDELIYIFASAKQGFATMDPAQPSSDIFPLMDLILERIPGPEVDETAGPCLMVTSLEFDLALSRRVKP
jgi:GTP-binding protein